MNLSQRLLCIASKVEKGSKIIDIGTDHGYVPIYLCDNKVIDYAIACDISIGSCDKAVNNIKKFNLEDKIKVVVSNGLKDVNTSNYDTIVIAGMGGTLIENILEQAGNKLNNISNLILSPQTEVEGIRRKIHSIGYKISDESMVYEDKKYYNIILAKKGKEGYNKDVEYYFGKLLLDRKDNILREFLQYELLRSKDILSSLQHVEINDANTRANQILEYIKVLEGIFSEYFM